MKIIIRCLQQFSQKCVTFRVRVGWDGYGGQLDHIETWGTELTSRLLQGDALRSFRHLKGACFLEGESAFQSHCWIAIGPEILQNIDSKSQNSHLTQGRISLTALTILGGVRGSLFWNCTSSLTFFLRHFDPTFTVTYTSLSKDPSGNDAVNLYPGNTWIETWPSWFSLVPPANVMVLTFWRRICFQTLAHPVFKMSVIQKPNKVALWNKRHFEEKRMEIIQHV